MLLSLEDTLTEDCINPLRWPGRPSSLVSTLWADQHIGPADNADALLYVALRRDTLRILLQPEQMEYIFYTPQLSRPHPPHPRWRFTQNVYLEYPEPTEGPEDDPGLCHGILVPKNGNHPNTRCMVFPHTHNCVATAKEAEVDITNWTFMADDAADQEHAETLAGIFRRLARLLTHPGNRIVPMPLTRAQQRQAGRDRQPNPWHMVESPPLHRLTLPDRIDDGL